MDEALLISELGTRIGTMVAAKKVGEGYNGNQVQQDKILKIQSQAILELSANKLDTVASSLVSVYEKALKNRAWGSYSEAKKTYIKKFILNLLTDCMDYGWKDMRRRHKEVNNWDDKQAIVEEEKVLPAPLPDSVAQHILSICSSLLLKPNIPEELTDVAGRLLFQLSASNYDNPIMHKINSSFEVADEITTPLNLIEHINLNKSRLSELLSRFSKAIDPKQGAFKKAPTSHWFLVSRVLTKAIWSWIDHYPMEFVGLCQSGTRLDGNPDKLFDMFSTLSGKNKKLNFWELQTMLLILCPDIMLKVALGKGTSKETNEKEKFMKALSKAIQKGKALADTAAVCYVDICKASTFVAKSKENGLRFLVPKIEPALQSRLFSPDNVKNVGPKQVALMTNCLVASFRLSPRKILNSLCTQFLKPEYPPIFKMVLVSTFQTIVDEGAILPWNPTIKDVYSSMGKQLRALFQKYLNGVRKYVELMAKTDRKSAKERDSLTYDIQILVKLIQLFNSAPELPLDHSGGSDIQSVEDTKSLLTGLVYCASQFHLEDLSAAASGALLEFHQPDYIAKWGIKNDIACFWDISCSVNKLLADVLIKGTELSITSIRSFVSLTTNILERRNAYLAKQPDKKPTDTKTKTSTTNALEAALLIHISNTEVEVVAHCCACVGLLCDEVDIIGIEDRLNGFVINYDIYREVAKVGIVYAGRMAQQRALRVLLRRSQETAGNFVAWKSVYKRWEQVTDKIKKFEHERLEKEAMAERRGGRQKTKAPDIIPDELLRTWNHLFGFLCAALGVALTQEITLNVQSRRGTTQKKVKISAKFIEELGELIVHKSPAIRETSTELIGSTISPASYTVLFDFFAGELQKHFGSAGQIIFSPAATQLNNQTISILKHILELAVDVWTADDLAKLKNFESLIDSMIRYCSGLEVGSDAQVPTQMKIKMCGCLCAMMAKHRYIGFKNEFTFRQKMVETVMEWISDFAAKGPNMNKKGYTQELDTNCVKAIAAMLKDLPLIKDDEQEVESSALGKYFQFFTQLLTRTKSDKGKKQKKAEFTVTALSNLLSANIDSALNYFVTMGYHDDLETRGAFLKVLSTLLNLGTEFETTEAGEKYDKLVDLLLDKDLEVVMSLCGVIQITEADALAGLLVRIFEANGKTLMLLKSAIQQEVSTTETSNTLFRRNSIATKLLAAYTKLIGKQYLKATLNDVLQHLITTTPPMELDPQRLPKGQDREVNLKHVHSTATSFLTAIRASVEKCPLEFRVICKILKDEVGKRFPGSEHSAIGGFIYLRYLCPAIVAPDGFGLVQPQALSPELRRGLILVTKVLQNLANKVKFTKEPYMQEMNVFIDDNMDGIGKLFDQFATVDDDEEPESEIDLPEEQKEADIQHLHFFLVTNVEKIRKSLTSVDVRQRGSDTFLRLRTILAQLGPASQPKKTKIHGTTFSAKTSKTTKEFMRIGAHLDISQIAGKKIFFKHGFTKDKRPVYYFIARRFDYATHIKQKEAFVYHILKTLEADITKKFVLVVDLSNFTKKENEIPTLLITKLQKVAPTSAHTNLEKIFFLYCNHDFKTYSKQIKKLAMPLFPKITFLSSVKELYNFIPESELGLPASTLAIENDVKVSFNVQLGSQKEVILKVTSNLFEITSEKPERAFGAKLSTKIVDLYHISKLQDYGMYKGTDEVFVRYENEKTFVFKCQEANRLVKELKSCKTRWALGQKGMPQNKRSFRASEVPGTLLFMALMNIGSSNHVLREEAYRLLTSIMTSFKLSGKTQLWDTSGLCIPKNSSAFLNRLSKHLAETERHITLDFLGEAIHGFDRIQSNLMAKQLCLGYIKHWLPNLKLYTRISDEPDREVKFEKTKSIISGLIEYTIRETSMTGPIVQSKVWEKVGSVPELLPCVIDIAVERAIKGGLGSLPLSVIGDIMVSMASGNARLVLGEIISRLMNAVKLSNEKPKEEIYEDIKMWPRISILLRLLLALSFDGVSNIGTYLPEILYLVLMLFGMGEGLIRATIHGLLINVVHNLCVTLKQQGLRIIISELNQQKYRVLFGLGGVKLIDISAFSKPRGGDAGAPMTMHSAETVASIILNILNSCASSGNCVGTNWHARLLSLITRTAWTDNVALRPRAIVALGVLCNHASLVTDTLLGKVLFTLKNVLGTVGQKLEHDLPLSLVICITKLFEHVPKKSKFFKPMFWISMLLLQIDEPKLFGASLNLMLSVVQVLDAGNCFAKGIVPYIMNAREQGGLDTFLSKADEVTGINFKRSFSFAFAAHLLKGLRLPATKTIAARVLSLMIDISAKNGIDANLLGYLAALLPVQGEDMEHINQLLLPLAEGGSLHQCLLTEQLLPDTMNAVLLFTLLVTLLKSSDVEREQLFIYQSLREGVLTMPEAFPAVYETLIPKMKWAIQNSQNQEIINTCLAIMKSIFSFAMTSSNQKRLDKNYLKDNLRFQGVLEAGTFNKSRSCTDTLVTIVVDLLSQVLENADL